MIQTLDGMFGQSTSSLRQSAMRALMTTRMTGGSVRDHCLKMMSHLTQAEIMGTKLEQKSKIDIILESLPDHYTQFKVNYNMNKLDLTPTELMHELILLRGHLFSPKKNLRVVIRRKRRL